VVTITPNDSVSDALQKMVEEQVEHLPVIDGGRLVGICTRTGVMRARQTQWAHNPDPAGDDEIGQAFLDRQT
jgi:CBS-domain-containing membrane protein